MARTAKTGLTRDQLVDFYQTMVRIRIFEETAIEYFQKGIVLGNMHASNGQEAVAVGVMKALKHDDFVSTHHRGNGHFVARGCDMGKMMAELMGKKEGLCKGHGGKMHQVDVSHGMMGASGIVGASCVLGPGHALYSQLYNPGQVTVSLFGDGAANQGMFHEGINIAALWKLPVVFVCENNQFGISLRDTLSCSARTIADRSVAYNIPGERVDGNDVAAVYQAVKKAVDRARKGKGPSLVECLTYRVQGHYEGDDMSYRPREETQDWVKNRDPIQKLKAQLVKDFGWTEDEDKKARNILREEVKRAVAYGEAGTPMGAADIEEDLFAA
jgi:pyruvate dehydrogenase E1 component alpha subunit